MYPLKEGAPYPRNQWYIAGWSSDFGEVPIERTILGDIVLLLREEGGQAVALSGLCPHRFMPLVTGTREGDAIRCSYHGITFDTSGECIAVPAVGEASKACRLKRYPTIEAGPWVWIWPGDPDRADPSLMPDLSRIGVGLPGWRVDPNDTMHFAARWMLVVDNLFDLTHIAHVHASFFGDLPICRLPPALDRGEGLLTFSRVEKGIEIDPFSRMLWPDAVGPIDSVLATEMLGPGLISAIGPHGTEGDASPRAGQHLGSVKFVHGVTPETPRTTHVFSAVARDFKTGDEALSAMICAQNKGVLAQDKGQTEILERVLDAHASVQAEVSIRPDAGGIQARRIIQQLLDAEAG